MLNPAIWLLLLSISMLIGSFLAGSVPLAFKLSESRLRSLSALSVGLLMGTALLIIIPEGVETLYSAQELGSTSLTLPPKGSSIQGRHIPASWQDANIAPAHWDHVTLDRRVPPPDDDDTIHQYGSKVEINDDMDEVDVKPKVPASDVQDAHDTSAHQYIGLALVLGFAIMFLIDQISSLHIHGSSSNGHPSTTPIEFTELNLMLEAVEEEDEEELEDEQEQQHDDDNETTANKHTLSRRDLSPSSRFRHASPKGPSQMTPTVGLVVHAAADGIALGASARHPHLSFVIFFAIMIHKAPSAFALTTVLMNEGLMRARIRRHLLVFSMAAPVGAILTYAALLFSGNPDDQNMAWWTGMLLIFSGGTFLYVAMHVMEEVKNHSGKKNTNFRAANGHSDKMSRSEVACVLIGMFIPAILNIEHGH
jgi:solute carrier family 39 (zinc transporter), member 9